MAKSNVALVDSIGEGVALEEELHAAVEQARSTAGRDPQPRDQKSPMTSQAVSDHAIAIVGQVEASVSDRIRHLRDCLDRLEETLAVSASEVRSRIGGHVMASDAASRACGVIEAQIEEVSAGLARSVR